MTQCTYVVDARIYRPGELIGRSGTNDPIGATLPEGASIVAMRVYEGPFRPTVKLDALSADPNFDLCACIPVRDSDNMTDDELVAYAAEQFIDLWRKSDRE